MDYDGYWISTLDMKIGITDENKIAFLFFDREMAADTVIMERTAMDENQKLQILAQETSSRMLNTSRGDGYAYQTVNT